MPVTHFGPSPSLKKLQQTKPTLETSITSSEEVQEDVCSPLSSATGYAAPCQLPTKFSQLAKWICFFNCNFVYLFGLCSNEWSEQYTQLQLHDRNDHNIVTGSVKVDIVSH